MLATANVCLNCVAFCKSAQACIKTELPAKGSDNCASYLTVHNLYEKVRQNVRTLCFLAAPSRNNVEERTVLKSLMDKLDGGWRLLTTGRIGLESWLRGYAVEKGMPTFTKRSSKKWSTLSGAEKRAWFPFQGDALVIMPGENDVLMEVAEWALVHYPKVSIA